MIRDSYFSSAVGDELHKAECIPRSELTKRYGNRGWFHNGNIAAVDFGRTFCSLAFTIPGEEIHTLKLNDYHTHVPLAILLEEVEQPSLVACPGAKTGSYEVVCFGYQAQKKIRRIPSGNIYKYLYFENFQGPLQHDEVSTHAHTHAHTHTCTHTHIYAYWKNCKQMPKSLNASILSCFI